MKIFSLRCLFSALLISMGLIVLGCGPSNFVRLTYKADGETALPRAGAPQITVIKFTDKRTNVNNIGERRDGSPFVASSSVTDWVSQSLGEELARKNVQVSYAASKTNASTAYRVSGEIEELRIQEKDATNLSATIRITVRLSKNGTVVYSENLNSGQNRQALPTASVAENLIADTLRDTLVVAANKIYAKMH